MSPDVRWEIPQTIDTIDPLSSHYNVKSAYAKTLRARRRRLGLGSVHRRGALPAARARQQQDGLPDLPHLLGDELLRLSSADEGEPARRAKQIRGSDRPQLHDLQPAGRARRCLHARAGWRGEKEPDGRDPFLERGRGQLAKPESRVGLLAAANRLRRRLQRPGFQPAFPAHHQQCRDDEKLRGLPSLEEQRQQRLDRVIVRLRHRDGEFLRPLRLCRGRSRRISRHRLDRTGRTAGRHRQSSAKAGLSG